MHKWKFPHAGDQPYHYRWVAELPCMCPWRCGQTGVQVSHSNQSRDGKGGAMKAHPWAVAALAPSCHVRIDSGKDLSQDERNAAWDHAHIRTLSELFRRGRLRPVRFLDPSIPE